MKKFILFVKKHYKKILLVSTIIAALIIAFVILHNIATADRGYKAIGGELVVVLAIPLLYKVIKRNYKDTVSAYREIFR